MSYINALSSLSNPVGSPPSAKQPAIGAPPAVASQPHIEAPAYDAGMDPAWHGILDPNDHALRNALSEMSPEVRQLLLMRLGKIQAPSAAHPAIPVGAAPATTSQAPGNI